MNKQDYDKYYQQGGSYVIPVEAFNELFEDYECFKNDCKKHKEVIDKAIKCIDYSTKYRNSADIYQFVDIESEILEPLKFILELDEENGNAYLKEFNDWLKRGGINERY